MLSLKNIANNPQRISKIKPLIDQYNWKEISFSSHNKDWKKLDLNSKSISINVLYVTYNSKDENVCKNHDYCYIEIPKKGKNILKYNHKEKSMKAPFIYAYMESLCGKTDVIVILTNDQQLK